MHAEYINPFIESSQTILKSLANMETALGKPYIKTSQYPGDTLAIIIELKGSLKGQVVFSMCKSVAIHIASAIMGGMSLEQLDDISKSALSEAANMIIGSTVTVFSNQGFSIDITPPTVLMGDSVKICTQDNKNLCVPLNIDGGGLIELDIALAG